MAPVENQMKKNIYIALEGVKGSGKSTLVNSLETFFKENNIDLSLIRPTKASSKNSILERIYDRYPCFNRYSFSRAIIYAYRSCMASKRTNWNSELILGDRSIVTSYATRWRKWFNSSYLSILFVNLMEPFARPPDIVLFLQVSIENLSKRIDKRNIIDIDSSLDRLEEMNTAYQEIYSRQIIKRLRDVKWIFIDGNQQEEKVFDEASKIIKTYLSGEDGGTYSSNRVVA